MLKGANLNTLSGIAIQIGDAFYIVYDEKLSDGEKKKVIDHLRKTIELKKFDYTLTDNDIIESEERKKWKQYSI